MQVSLALVADGRVVSASGARALVPWWSFTKTVIAAAALALVRDGRLVLDETLPDRAYSLRQLLQHRAGLAEYGELPAYHEAVARRDPPWPASELLERTDAQRLRFAPGTRWKYSNVGYFLVRRLIEAACGEPLDGALRRLVLEPLGIAGARIAESPDDLVGVEMGDGASYHPGWVYHGLLIGPLDQAALLLARLMTGKLLPGGLLDAMRAPLDTGPWAGPGYGLGVVTGTTALGMHVTGHSGKGPGSVIAAYHAVEFAPSLTAAAFMTGDDPAIVEHAVFAALRR